MQGGRTRFTSSLDNSDTPMFLMLLTKCMPRGSGRPACSTRCRIIASTRWYRIVRGMTSILLTAMCSSKGSRSSSVVHLPDGSRARIAALHDMRTMSRSIEQCAALCARSLHE